MEGPAPLASPLVVCLACRAGDQADRARDLEALTQRLGGWVHAEVVSGGTLALRLHASPAAAKRLLAALMLGGATPLGEPQPSMLSDLVVLITGDLPRHHREGS